MDRLNSFVSDGTSLILNLKDNPLVCDCRSMRFLEWLKTCGVTMDKIEDYRCMDGYPKENIDQLIVEVRHLYLILSHLYGEIQQKYLAY